MRLPFHAMGLAAALFALAAAGLAPAAPRKDSVREWLDGPVHYLIEPAEIKEFKAQKTDADRAAFIERFWRRRDPTPDTLVNEYRQLFWDRVRQANENFVDTSRPGWMTDRGKIYILYGPPEEIKEDPNADAGTGGTSGHGLIRWVYTKPNRNNVPDVVYVPFVRDVTGEYRVSYDPKLASAFFDWNQVEDNRTQGLGNFLQSIQPGGNPVDVMLDLGRMQEAPPQEAIVLDSVETAETFAFLPLTLAIDRFQPSSAQTLAVVTVSIPGAAGSTPPSLIARFSRKGQAASTGSGGAGAGSRLLGEGSFRVDGDGETRIAQGRVLLDPGAWDATVLSVDVRSGVSRIYRGRVDPLPAGPDLHLSDVVVASAMEPLSFASQASYESPYIIGGFKVTPTPSASIVRGSPIRVFFEVYGGTTPYHLAYQLEGQEKPGTFVTLGKPQEHDGTERGQGFELATSPKWPAGSYRLNVTVTDAKGKRISQTAEFVLVAEKTP